jgi:hypothetical protein
VKVRLTDILPTGSFVDIESPPIAKIITDLSTVPGMRSKIGTWSAAVTDNLNPNLEETLVMLILCSHGTQIVNMSKLKQLNPLY